MERHFYSSGSLSRTVAAFEDRYGLSSEMFYELYRGAAGAPAGVPNVVAAAWAGALEERDRVASLEGDFSSSARLLELA